MPIFLLAGEDEDREGFEYLHKLLWKSPELLRQCYRPLCPGTSVKKRSLQQVVAAAPPGIISASASVDGSASAKSAGSQKGDVYAFGVVCWQMGSKEQPFRGQHPHSVIYQVSQAS